MPRSSRPFTAAVLAALAFTACSASGEDKAAPVTTVSAGGPVTTSAAPVPTSADELVKLVVVAMPPGFTVQAEDVGDTGPTDLAQAAGHDGRPGAEDALRAEGFVRGYRRLWSGPSTDEILVSLYQFETPTGAAADFARPTPRLTQEAGVALTPFTLDGIPPGQAQAGAGATADLAVAAGLFTKGVYVVHVRTSGPLPDSLRDWVATIAEDQYSRL